MMEEMAALQGAYAPEAKKADFVVYVYRAQSIRPVLHTDSYLRARKAADEQASKPDVDAARVLDPRGFFRYETGRRL